MSHVGSARSFPILYVCFWLFSTRPDSTPTELLLRVTQLEEPPSSISDLKVHYAFEPTLGDGSALISFRVSEAEGPKIASKLSFTRKESVSPEQIKRFSETMIEIEDPEFGLYDDEGWHEGVVMTNSDRTVFIWEGSF